MAVFIITAVLVTAVLLIGYKRYWPVNVQRISPDEAAGHPVIDVRDWQEAGRLPLAGAEHIPCGYIPRNAGKFGGQEVYIAAASAMERNFSVRLLKKYNIHVKGFICMNESV
ncbi:hypothetical protein [Domibacillus enclensis]|uniref:Rhodanese domain-containing protein n=1 Tax=Domibacillus enclensis TaxID=1017273 RepID=A0A1N6P097_9BACI|nr:hypothetical protein [Domibacillus enclensis]OXS80200.1 hypothetical protein B1B05_01610 [Domibacillus enclensis]SIP97805.1 hypothetical protein SAMN05443094_101339 [Domibacillus enclensis]